MRARRALGRMRARRALGRWWGALPRALGLLGALASTACHDEGPPLVDLARLEVRGVLPVGEVAVRPGGAIVLEARADDLWLVAPISRADWRPAEKAEAPERPGELGANGLWRTELPVLALGDAHAGETPYLLEFSGTDGHSRRVPYEADRELFDAATEAFTTQGLELRLRLAPGALPPESARLAACANYESVDDGVRRVEGRRVSGSGFWVPAGRPRTIDLAIPPGSVLRFATLATAVLGDREGRTASQRFRVRLEGVQLFEHVQESSAVGESLTWHRIELPRGGVRRARLTFEVEGPFAATAILGPMVRPEGPGRRDLRPNVLVFLADTFRADNLAVYGATHGVSDLTPRIDAFTAEARVFRQAWSVSTHTLPTHSTLFSGLFPPQSGQVDYYNPLPSEVLTLAEVLARAGYRCGAITDSVMVSQAHGLQQGFELFDERRGLDTLQRTRAFLDADDGRPVFLFVQTYRVHSPYHADAATRERLGRTLDLAADYEALVPAVEALHGKRASPPETEAERTTARRLQALYLAGVPDLDRLFGAFLDEVRERGLTKDGVVVFTSDHGEAFFEHGRAFHSGPVWEEELRVPLLLHGPGIPAGIESRPVSLIDFAPTVAALAGVAGPVQWEGRSLLDPGPSHALFAFQSHSGEGRTLAVIEGTRKLIGVEEPEALRAGEWLGAFDLERDPSELESQLGRTEWPKDLALRRRDELLRLLEPLVTPEASRLTGDDRAAMEQLGYVGDGKR